MWTEAIGWASALVLLATIVQQVHRQWTTRSVAGVSRWLFGGQMLASLGFSIYSWLVGNWVFVAVNVALLISALVGQVGVWRTHRRIAAMPAAAAAGARE